MTPSRPQQTLDIGRRRDTASIVPLSALQKNQKTSSSSGAILEHNPHSNCKLRARRCVFWPGPTGPSSQGDILRSALVPRYLETVMDALEAPSQHSWRAPTYSPRCHIQTLRQICDTNSIYKQIETSVQTPIQSLLLTRHQTSRHTRIKSRWLLNNHKVSASPGLAVC